MDFYNTDLRHSALAGQTPAKACRGWTTCGYDGQGSRLAHIPTGSTAATGVDKQDSGGMIRRRNTP